MGPSKYTHGHHESVLRAHAARTAEGSAGYLLPHMAPGMSLLDVGCGPGSITIDFAQRLAPGRVIGIDPSAEAIDRAREAASDAGSAAVFRVGDIYTVDDGAAGQNPPSQNPPSQNPPSEHASGDSPPGGVLPRYDVVHAHQVLHHVPDPVDALRRMRVLCAPGGVVAARDADYSAMFWHPEIPELDQWRGIYHELSRHNGAQPDAARRLPGWAREAGFAEVTVSASVWCYATPHDTAWWAGSWADRARYSSFADQALELGLATRDDLRRIADGWLAWASRPDAFFAIPHAEVLCRR